MGLRDVRRRLTATTEELHHRTLVERWSVEDVTSIGQVQDRARARIGGEVQGVQVVPRAGSPTLEASIHDGTGRAVARFTGRRAVAGITPGRHIVVEGLARVEGGHVVLVNPSYTLLRS